MVKVKDNKEYLAYKIETENSLDEFLANEINEFDSIHTKENCCRVSFGGVKLFSFCFGDWLVVFSDSKVKNYTDEEFLKEFSLV